MIIHPDIQSNHFKPKKPAACGPPSKLSFTVNELPIINHSLRGWLVFTLTRNKRYLSLFQKVMVCDYKNTCIEVGFSNTVSGGTLSFPGNSSKNHIYLV